MERIRQLRGSIVAIVTPFADDGRVDYGALAGLLDWHVAAGTAAVAVCGTTGETPSLTADEISELVNFTVKKIAGRVPVIAGAGTNDTVKTTRACHAAAEAGADGLLIVSPYYNKPTPRGLYLHYAAVARAVSLPIIIYNVPGRTGRNVPADVVLRLAEEFPNVVGVKEASGDLAQIMDILNRRPAGFRVYAGDDALALALVALGGDGCISVVANEIPAEFARMMNLALTGDIAAARELHYRFLGLMNLNFIESNPIPVKAALAMMGKIRENYRLPMSRMEEPNRDRLRAELAKLGLVS